MNINNLMGEQFELGRKEQTIYVHSPIPTTFAWHNLTEWRYAEELYRSEPLAWSELKKKNKIPFEVIQRVER